MKDMVKTSYVRENIGDTKISSIYRKQLFQALDQSYQSLKGTKKISFNNRITSQISILDSVEEDDKIGFLEKLKNQALKLQAMIDFHSTKEGRRSCTESLNRILCVDLIKYKENKKRAAIEIVKYLQSILTNMSLYDEDKIRYEINSIDRLKNLILLHSIEEQEKVLECMDEIRSKLVKTLFELKEQEHNHIKKNSITRKDWIELQKINRERNVKENTREEQMNDIFREQIKIAMDEYCDYIRFQKIKPIKIFSSKKEIDLLNRLEQLLLKLQAKIEFRTSKKEKEQLSRTLDRIISAPIKPIITHQDKINFHDQTIHHLEEIIFSIDKLDFETIQQTLVEIEILKNKMNMILKDTSNIKTSLEYSAKDLERLLNLQKEKLEVQKRLTKIK